MGRGGRFDAFLLGVTIVLVVIGFLMVASATTTGLKGKLKSADPADFIFSNGKHIALGFAVLFLAARVDYRIWFRLANPALIFLFFCLVGLLLFGGPSGRQTAARWIPLGPVSFQPSVFVAYISALLWAKAAARGTEQGYHVTLNPYIFPGLVIVTFATVIFLQPDLGTAAILLGLSVVMMFVAGAPMKPLAGAGGMIVAFGVIAMASTPWRRARVRAMFDPWELADGSGYQIVHSLFAFGRGGLFGVGLGEGQEKALYLPECHTDFIFSVIGEELGLAGTLVVSGLFILFLWRGYRIAVRHKGDLLAYYTALSLTALFAIQIVVNLMVVTNLLPTKGMTLPFISYGGTSTLASFWAVGVLLHLSSRGEQRS